MNPSHLPVNDPKYRYPTSRNPYWTKLNELPGRVYVDHATEEIPGRWRKKFSELNQEHGLTSRPLIIEIGCNGGHVITEWAKQNPQNLYMGLDYKFKQIFRAHEKATKKELQNIFFLRANAERFEYMFGEEELDQVCVFFPDPWEKKSRQKHRFLTQEWIDMVWTKLRPNGEIFIKTDHSGYFQWILDEIEKTKSPWTTTEMTWDLHKHHPNPESLQFPEVTLFEGLFIKDQIPIKSIRIQKTQTH